MKIMGLFIFKTKKKYVSFFLRDVFSFDMNWIIFWQCHKIQSRTLHHVSEYENILKIIINRRLIQFKSIASLLLSKGKTFFYFICVCVCVFVWKFISTLSWTMPTMKFNPRNVSKCSFINIYYIETHTHRLLYRIFQTISFTQNRNTVEVCSLSLWNPWNWTTEMTHSNKCTEWKLLQLKIASSNAFNWKYFHTTFVLSNFLFCTMQTFIEYTEFINSEPFQFRRMRIIVIKMVNAIVYR